MVSRTLKSYFQTGYQTNQCETVLKRLFYVKKMFGDRPNGPHYTAR